MVRFPRRLPNGISSHSSSPVSAWSCLWFQLTDVPIMTAGLFSGLVSHIGHARWQYPRLIARLRAQGAGATASLTRIGMTSSAKEIATTVAESTTGVTTKAMKAANEGTYSLGSSGAIYALFALTAFGFPDAEITFVIPPWIPINIQTGFYALVAIDVLGVVRGWR